MDLFFFQNVILILSIQSISINIFNGQKLTSLRQSFLKNVHLLLEATMLECKQHLRLTAW